MDVTLPLRKGDRVLVRAVVAYDQTDPAHVSLRVEDDFRDLYLDRAVVDRMIGPMIEPGETVAVGDKLHEFVTVIDDDWAVVRDHPEDIPQVVTRGMVRPIRAPLPVPVVAHVPEPAPMPVPHVGRSE